MKTSLYMPIIDNGMGLSQTAWAQCLAGLCLAPFFNRDRRIVMDSISYPYPDGAMNVATAQFLASDCDEMLVIDTDVLFTPEQVEMLLSHAVPLVFGLYPLKKVGLYWPCQSLSGDNPFGGDNPLVEVATAARGFMRVHRNVFEMLKASSDSYTCQETGEMRFQFWKTLPGGHSEDFAFCKAYRAIGGKVLVDQRIICNHIGRTVFPIPGTY